jgi:4-hydroxybenzoate polyprenyltransferase
LSFRDPAGPVIGAFRESTLRLGFMIHASASVSESRPSQLALVARDIKLSHSVFALPFAVLAACMAWPKDRAAGTALWMFAAVVVCMVTARTWAMLVNRLADRNIDAENARTSKRVFAAGAMSARDGWRWAWGSALCFVATTSVFGLAAGNWWPLILSGPVLAWIAFYSYTKRFTWLCHVVLGSSLAAAPLAAAIAVDPGTLGLPALGSEEVGSVVAALPWIAGFVLCWVAGFDVIYALQDVSFDRARGLSSMPASLGVRPALWISRVLHIAAAGCLWAAWSRDARFGAVFGAGVGLVCALLALEHVVLARRGQAGLDMAFFTINGIVSVVAGVLGCCDVVF